MGTAKAPPKRATINDVARLAGVSAATVSNAINNRRYVEAQTKLRIDAAAARLGYTPNVHARRLRTTGIGTIGLFSSMPFAVSGNESRLGFLMEIAGPAAITALENGFALLLVPSMPSGLPRFDQLAIDGAIVLEPSADDGHVAALRRRGIPLVTIGKQPGAPPKSAAVDLRSAHTAELLFAHLRGQSARRIALMIGAERRMSYVQTEAVYARLAAAAGMHPEIVRIDEASGDDGAYAATLQLLARRPKIDGILALVDTFAVGAVRALHDSGIAIPERMRLATRYDGRRARDSAPALTALDMQLDRIATLAVTLLLEQMRPGASGRTVNAPRPVLIPRASTASTEARAR